MHTLHFGEARHAALTTMRRWIADSPGVEQVLLVRDLFGKFSVAVWTKEVPDCARLARDMASACGSWWTGGVLDVLRADQVSRDLYAKSLEQGRADMEVERLRVLDRHRTRTSWFGGERQPLWTAPDPDPPIVAFYSFKGGLGRSTLLASFAIQRARAGERVCVIDLDLDSPGVGRLLAADDNGLTSPTGVVDFLLEQRILETELPDYYHRCDRVAGEGELVVFPAGSIDGEYSDKLARVDFDDASYGLDGALVRLLTRARDELQPRWILVDCRTGISDSAGRILSGIAHAHVLLGTTQEQSWQGLRLVLDRLGKERLEAGRGQSEVVLVQAMVPAGEAGKLARDAFQARAEREFAERYYAAAEDDSDDVWSLADLDNQDAPHVPISVGYDANLADFRDIADVVELLCRVPCSSIGERILVRLGLGAGE